jgi:hypothetical protein
MHTIRMKRVSMSGKHSLSEYKTQGTDNIHERILGQYLYRGGAGESGASPFLTGGSGAVWR